MTSEDATEVFLAFFPHFRLFNPELLQFGRQACHVFVYLLSHLKQANNFILLLFKPCLKLRFKPILFEGPTDRSIAFELMEGLWVHISETLKQLLIVIEMGGVYLNVETMF